MKNIIINSLLIILSLNMCEGLGRKPIKNELSEKAKKWLNSYNDTDPIVKKYNKRFSVFSSHLIGTSERIEDKRFKIIKPSMEYKKEDILYDLEIFFTEDLQCDSIENVIKRHSLKEYIIILEKSKAYVKIIDSTSFRNMIIELADENTIKWVKPNYFINIDGKPSENIIYLEKVLEIRVKPGLSPFVINEICEKHNLNNLYPVIERTSKNEPYKGYKGPGQNFRDFKVEILDTISVIKKVAILLKDPYIENVSPKTVSEAILN